MLRTLGTIAAALASVAATAAAAQVDQSNLTANTSILGAANEGQSFTAGLPGVNFATFYTAAEGLNISAKVNLYAGSGFGGALLGTTNSLAIPIGSTDPATLSAYTFAFANAVPLTVGQTYTLQLSATGSLTDAISTANPYAGGSLFFSGGAAVPGDDLKFAEGLTGTAAVPEPAAWAMVLAGFGLLGGALRRRRAVVRFA